MKVIGYCILGFALAAQAFASPVIVTISGTTGEIKVGEGPIFGHSSYQTIPPGAPFVLTFTFEETKGNQTIATVSGDLITESKIESETGSSPGTNAVLQIGSAVWEFGPSMRAQVVLNTAEGSKGEEFAFTQGGANHVAARIVPGKGGYWPKNGDWRASFVSTTLEGSTAAFAADNDRVSAKGSLVPEMINVAGVDLDGQWLRKTTSERGSGTGEKQWVLAHASPRGGYIVEEVTRTILGSVADGAAVVPSYVKYWRAWQVPAGQNVPSRLIDSVPPAATSGRRGEEKVTTTARFYEDVTLPSSFAAGKSPYAAGQLSSTIDPELPTNRATLPVTESMTLRF